MNKLIQAFALLLGLLAGCTSPAGGLRGEVAPDRYVNCDYGFELAIPAGLKVDDTRTGLHGTTIRIPVEGATVHVYAQYDLSEANTLDSAFLYYRDILEYGKADWSARPWRRERLKGMDTIAVTASLTVGGAQWLEEHRIAFRTPERPDAEKIAYHFWLSSPESTYSEAVVWLLRVVEGFELRALPVGPCPGPWLPRRWGAPDSSRLTGRPGESKGDASAQPRERPNHGNRP